MPSKSFCGRNELLLQIGTFYYNLDNLVSQEISYNLKPQGSSYSCLMKGVILPIS